MTAKTIKDVGHTIIQLDTVTKSHTAVRTLVANILPIYTVSLKVSREIVFGDKVGEGLKEKYKDV